MNTQFLGSSLDEFLKDEGMLASCQAVAVKRVLSYQLLAYMSENNYSKTKMAQKLNTSRSGLDRLLDETNLSITLDTMVKTASVVGKKLSVSFSA
jgi:predicted XRE-type DNA-binding protein